MTTRRIRAIVAEDEPAARQHVVRLLQRHADVDVVASCANGAEAIDAARSTRPDVVLLDIQMPGLDGFDVVRALDRDTLPVVIFITAHSDHAIQAFDVHALDYLLKPFEDARFDRALAWARTHIHAQTRRGVQAHLRDLVAPTPLTPRATTIPGRLAVKHDGAIRFVPLREISHITGESCYARIHTAARTYLVRETLASLLARLPAALFARVHRSTIVNLAQIRSMEPLTHGESRLHLSDAVSVKASRHYRDVLVSLKRRATNPPS